MENIKRTDYVDEGGCRECKTGSQPEDTIMTAKLSIKEEANNMGKTDENHTEAGNSAEGNNKPDDENHIEAKKNQGNQTQGNGGSSSGGNQGMVTLMQQPRNAQFVVRSAVQMIGTVRDVGTH